jgi:hypothetical protein
MTYAIFDFAVKMMYLKLNSMYLMKLNSMKLNLMKLNSMKLNLMKLNSMKSVLVDHTHYRQLNQLRIQ